MQVQLKNNVFKATQWFKDGDHPAIVFQTAEVPHGYGFESSLYEWDTREVEPGDWIVEMYDGIHLYSDEEFKKLFVEAGRKPEITME